MKTSKLVKVQNGLQTSLRSIREKIERLESEKADLFDTIQELKIKGVKKAENLEKEVKGLRKEVTALQILLNDKK